MKRRSPSSRIPYHSYLLLLPKQKARRLAKCQTAFLNPGCEQRLAVGRCLCERNFEAVNKNGVSQLPSVVALREANAGVGSLIRSLTAQKRRQGFRLGYPSG